jgi:hypothetical protein
MKNSIIILLTVVLLFGCKKDKEIEIQTYNFNININIDYKYDTIVIGDTIWITSEVYKSLTDIPSGEIIYFGDALINNNIIVRSWSIENQEYQTGNIDFHLKTYIPYLTYTNNATIIGMLYYFSKDKYYFSLGIIFNKQGIYSIDGDFLNFKNYYTDELVTFGGGYMQFYDINENYREATLHSVIVADNRNINLYNQLSNEEKNIFDPVNSENQNKYFFINVIDTVDVSKK